MESNRQFGPRNDSRITFSDFYNDERQFGSLSCAILDGMIHLSHLDFVKWCRHLLQCWAFLLAEFLSYTTRDPV